MIASADLADGMPAATELPALQAAVSAAPDDLKARMSLAKVLFATGQTEASIECAFEVVKQDRNFDDKAPQTFLLQAFEVLGANDPLVQAGRRRLSNMLF